MFYFLPFHTSSAPLTTHPTPPHTHRGRTNKMRTVTIAIVVLAMFAVPTVDAKMCKITGSSCGLGFCDCGTCDASGKYFPFDFTPYCVADCGKCGTPAPPPPPAPSSYGDDDDGNVGYDDDGPAPTPPSSHTCEISGSSCGFTGFCNCITGKCNAHTGRCEASCGQCGTPPWRPPPPPYVPPPPPACSITAEGQQQLCPSGTCACGKCDTGSKFPKVNNTNVCYADCGKCGTEEIKTPLWITIAVVGGLILLCASGFGAFRFQARKSRLDSYSVQVNDH